MNADLVLQGAAAGVLARVVADTSVRLGVSLRALGNRALKDDEKLVKWFDTYRLAESVPELVGVPEGVAGEALEAVVGGDEFHAVVHELLAARVTDAPEAEVRRGRRLLELALAPAAPEADWSPFAKKLFDYYDRQICELVGRLQGADGELLPRLRSEAFSARMIASLRAIERKLAAGAERDPEQERAYLRRYRRHVVEEFGRIEPPDFERRRRVPISDLYVTPEIRPMSSADPEPITLWELGERLDRTVLLGDPGGGKTTASSVLMHWHARSGDRRVPFLVTLREFAAHDPPARSVIGHIEHGLETFYQCPAPAGLVSRLFLAGSSTVIFDGLDELIDTARRADVTAIVERFCSEYPMVRVLVTSRLVGYDQARLDKAQFTCYEIGGFDYERVGEYVEKWFAQEDGIGRDEAESLAASFMEESHSVPDLRANPLMLALMCILYRGEGSIPRNRAEVYEQCASLLFRKWDARRRIHTELRARAHVEPALRHLAHWLFVRQERESAVTERDLIRKTTEFLHGRGFESVDDAREAAEEFVRFCRGRAWVFSDAGTTAAGEKLYTFTHRTFLEYFTAAHLAMRHDTPEQLAQVLAPRIIKREWPVVAELALQMKDGMVDQGAARFYRSLLDDKKYTADPSRSNLLFFLTSSLASVDPPPTVVRALSRRCLDHLFQGYPNHPLYFDPFGQLINCSGAYRDIVADEIRKKIEDVLAAGDQSSRVTALRLASCCYAGIPTSRYYSGGIPSKVIDFWSDFVEENCSRYAAEYAAFAHLGEDFRYLAMAQGTIAAEDVLAEPGGFEHLLDRSYAAGIFGVRRAPILGSALMWAVGVPGIPTRKSRGALRAIGRYLLDNPTPPWLGAINPARWMSVSAQPEEPAAPQLDDEAFVAAAALLMIIVEGAGNVGIRPGHPQDLGGLAPLYPYLAKRLNLEPDIALPALPLRADMQRTFEAWALGRQDFTRPS